MSSFKEEDIMKDTKENVKKEIAIYGRISTRERALNGYGLDMQIQKCKDYLSLHDIVCKAEVYRDDGYSAKDMKRPDMNRLMEKVEKGTVKVIIIYKLDRLTRSVLDVYEFIKKLMEKECNLIAVVDNIDIHSANGRLIVGILAIIAQWERETVIERTNDALVQMCEQGKFPIGYTPLGYKKKNNRLSINKKTQRFITHIFKSTSNGKLPVEVYREVKSMGFHHDYADPTAFIKKILKSTIYFGEFTYRGKIYNDIVPAIISKELYLEAQAMSKKRYKLNNNVKYYFGYKVRCQCGEICECKSTKKVLADETVERYYYYYCDHCKKRVNQNFILNDVLSRILDIDFKAKEQKQKSKYKQQLYKVNAKINKLYMSYQENDELDTKSYLFTLAKLQTEKEKLMLLLNTEAIQQNLEWKEKTDEERRVLIHRYVAHVVIDMDIKQILKVELY